MAGAHGAIIAHPQAEAQALDLAGKAIALRSVRGPVNKTAEVAALYKTALVDGGFAGGQITISTVDDTAYLIARWPGTEPKLKCYLEVVVPVSAAGAPSIDDVDAARLIATHRLAELKAGMAAALGI